MCDIMRVSRDLTEKERQEEPEAIESGNPISKSSN
jgi:hypothetical protein